MKLKSILLVMLALCLTLCLCACGDDTSTEDTDSKTTASAANNESTAPSASTPANTTTTTIINSNETEATENNNATATAPVVTGPVDGKANYTVTVTDEAGNPIPGAFVQLCLESCIPGMTNAQGVASYSNMAVADYKVSFITVPAGYELPTDNYYFEEDTYEMTLVLKAAN